MIQFIQEAGSITKVVIGLAPTLGLSILVLLLGLFLVDKIKVLKAFCIPAPVVGGLIFSILALILYQFNVCEFMFDEVLKDFFMLCFFATVGFSANLAVLKKAGPQVVVFLVITTILICMQNIIGIGVSMAFGENPLLGIATGSVPMVGGHGTAASFGPVLVEAGLVGAKEITLAAATFGLISGSLIGGPTAKRLIEKRNLESSVIATSSQYETLEEDSDIISSSNLMNAFFQIFIAVGLGALVSMGLNKLFPVLTFPPYIGAMIVAVFMRNIFTEKTFAPTRTKEIAALGDVFIAVFLVQALMVLKLWQLANLALPLFIILIVQVVFMFLWANFVTFNAMGRDYDAAVLAAGNCGFGLGATPNAMANMSTVTNKYGPSPKAFFILPSVLFIDIVNTAVIAGFITFVTTKLM